VFQEGFLEKYEPLRKIGRGKYGAVYLARRKNDGAQFAVKAINKERLLEEDRHLEGLYQ
jgi:serine/threonine protein kinase